MSSTTHLANLIHQRCQVLLQLRELGERQRDLIELGDTSALLRLLGIKQQVLAVLQATERKLEPYQREDPESREWESPQERERCAAEAAKCQTLLREILEYERQHEQQMLQRRNRAAIELRQARDAAEASGAYHANALPAVLHRNSVLASLIAEDRIPLDLTS